MRRDERLRKSERLLARSGFRRTYDHGQRRNFPLFTAFVLKTDLDQSRLGVTVTKQVGSAVVRNRCKRLVREAFRKNKCLGPRSLDLVINVKRAMVNADQATVDRDLREFLAQLNS